MRKLLVVAALAVLPAVSQAQLALGFRLGFAPAMGDAAKDAEMKDGIKSQVPLQIDAMFKVSPDIALGAYFSYGFGQPGDLGGLCDITGVDCSASALRVGLQGTYSFNKASPTWVPWLGLGFGYESASVKAEDAIDSIEVTYSGWEFLNLQGGGDYKVNEKFSIGPYLQYSFGQFSSVKVENTIDPALNFDGDVQDTAMHQWFGFGVRGKFDL